MMDKVRNKVDGILAEISVAKARLERQQRAVDDEIDRVRRIHAPGIETAQAELTALDKELRQVAKENRAELFGDGDRCDLSHGSLIVAVERRVVRSRGVLAEILSRGWEHLVRRAKPVVDWDAVEKLPDPELKDLGTERRVRERFEYELRQDARRQAGA